ncbi:hypothetical protein [Lysobacter sp. A289]
MHSPKAHDSDQLETAAAAVVGQIIFVFSSLETNVGLYLRNAVGGNDVEAVNPLIVRLSFKSKVDALREVIEHKSALSPPCMQEFRQWHTAIDRYRSKRNSFVHGAWAMHHFRQQVINVAPGLPSGKPRKETRYTIEELGSELAAAKQIAAAFYDWSEKWPA